MTSDECVEAAACSLNFQSVGRSLTLQFPCPPVLVDLAVHRRDDPPDGFDRRCEEARRYSSAGSPKSFRKRKSDWGLILVH